MAQQTRTEQKQQTKEEAQAEQFEREHPKLFALLSAVFRLLFVVLVVMSGLSAVHLCVRWSSPVLPHLFSKSNWAYALAHDAYVRHVDIAPKPPDCDFLHAPLGSKGCHYEAQVSVMYRDPKTGQLKPPLDFSSIPGVVDYRGDPREGIFQFALHWRDSPNELTEVYVIWRRVPDE